MARQTQKVEVNSFVQGLITEASPLTFPENASLDEDNFNLRRDGSRDRRLGMDYEENSQIVSTGITNLPSGELAVSSFSWENAGGIPEQTLLVIQTGSVVKVFNPDISPLSLGEVYSQSLPIIEDEQVFSYAVVDGDLVVATGNKDLQILSWDGASVSRTESFLQIRDMFGVEDRLQGRDLFSGSGLSVRPNALSETHRYNLRNQSWALPREEGGPSGNIRDTIQSFSGEGGVFPSNSDSVNYALYPNPADVDNRTGSQFFRRDLFNNPPGSFPSPRGYFIIDALERGKSRIEETGKLYSDQPALVYPITDLPLDKTPGGPTSVTEYAGRVWYAGFSGDIQDGDERSPSLSSYVMYSQLVTDPSKITHCFQEGDPTSKESPDLVDTDGGFIRVDGAYNIQSLINVGEAVMVVAENGVWMISGGSDYGFSATNNMRRKVADHGAQSSGSIVVVDNSFMFWSDDAIYHLTQDQFGSYQANNITQQTIQTFYDNIPPVDKFYAQGAYDSYDRKVRWVYQNRVGSTGEAKELILDMTLGAFYPHTIGTTDGGVFPRVACPVQVPAFRLTDVTSEVVYEGEQVVYEGEDVSQKVSVRGAGTRELYYVTLTSLNPVSYTFSLYRDASFKDWVSEDGVGVDAPAFLVTGYLSGGDFMRYKQVPYIQFYFTRTEDGFEEDGSGNLFPTNPSSCFVQAQWEWANSANSNRWGRTFQAYRYKRQYMPTGVNDPFDNGFEVVTTKNKLRGKGKVLSLLISTEPEKDCRLLGWSMLVGVSGNV